MKLYNNIFLLFLFLLGNVVFCHAQDSPSNSSTFSKQNKLAKIGFKSFKPNSILNDGDWFKIAIPSDGVYKIDFNFMQDEVKLNPSTISFSSFGVFGQAMGLLPEYNGTERTDDLAEIGIKIKDFNNNNIWDSNDFILFYGKGPHLWHYDNSLDEVSHTFNIYTEQANYFISTNKGTGKAISSESSPSVGSSALTTFDDWYLIEEDKNNVIYTELSGAAGTGRQWYGEKLSNVSSSQEFGLNIPDIISSEPLKIQGAFAAAASGVTSSFNIKNNGVHVFTKSILALPTGNYSDVVVLGSHKGLISNPSSSLNLSIAFSSGSNQGKGWLDYLEIIATRSLKLSGSFIQFRNFSSLNNGISKYSVSNANSNTEIWDVTNGAELIKINGTLTGSNFIFSRNSDVLKDFIAIDISSNAFDVPSFVKSIENQNLHHLPNLDYVIITTNEFKAAADKLKEFHQTTNNLEVEVVMLESIYNEFSSGQQDLTAIRDFLKMFYDRNLSFEEKIKYVLLLGDASFDFKDRLTDNQNIIPTYESEASISTINSYCTDDYIGFLDDDEGLNMGSNTGANLDIAIGRIPVNTAEEAMEVINKIIYYKTNISDNGWKNELTFVADDEDSNLHFRDAEEITNISTIENKDYYNFDKIYIDSYSQSNAAGGDRYPDVVDAILRKLFTGTFFVDYTGHGGPTNWAQERIFNIQDINKLKNKDKLPLFMTATCDFSPFDDPTIVSAGEALLLNPNGGAIALLSTTRLVFSHSNKQMNKAVLNHLFQKVNGRMPTVGEILMNAKNETTSNDNNRKFVLLGDPAMTLEYPKYEVVTTKINGQSILQEDTMKALSKVSVEGGVMDENGALMTDFNGIVYANIYDKEATYNTKGNDEESSSESYKLRNNIIFKGKSSVVNGQFKFEFIVPKDINYSFGNGKITYYAEKTDEPNIDAHGYTYNFKVGGTDENFIPDNEGPIVEVYMNDSNFVFGGITNENPVLLVRLSDESGINTIGNSVGHDLVGILDDNTQKQHLLNDYYEANLNDFTGGNISYLLNNLENGLHSIKVKAWDVHNNPGEGYTEFVVASSAIMALENVLNYPNPFTTSTSFVFEHNRPGEDLDVKIQIYSVTGEIVKTIHQIVTSSGFKIAPNQINWDGLGDYGNYIGRGIYLYKVNVNGSDGYNAFKFEKLVILK